MDIPLQPDRDFDMKKRRYPTEFSPISSTKPLSKKQRRKLKTSCQSNNSPQREEITKVIDVQVYHNSKTWTEWLGWIAGFK